LPKLDLKALGERLLQQLLRQKQKHVGLISYFLTLRIARKRK
jgi:hypothetical protein